jgi:hypothetical protein
MSGSALPMRTIASPLTAWASTAGVRKCTPPSIWEKSITVPRPLRRRQSSAATTAATVSRGEVASV